VTTYREFDDWPRIERDWLAWWRGELERPLIVVEALGPSFSAPNTGDWVPHIFLSQFPLDMPVDEVLDRVQPGMDAVHLFGDAYPRWWVNFGPGVMAAFLGAQIEYAPGTTWFHEIERIESLADLQLVYDPDNVWWRRVQAITQAAIQRWGQTVAIGLTDIGGNLDILASLRGTHNLLLDLYDAPDEVERLTRAITPLWQRCYDELCAMIAPAGHGITCWAPHWNPGRGYMLQSDFSYMISPEMFDRYVLPDLEACCAAMDYAFYHMDGKGQIRHLDKLLGLDRLRGIQWQPGDGAPMADEWPDLLRRIRDAGKLCQVYVTREGARRLLRELDGRGFLIVITETLMPDEAEAFLQSLPVDIVA
jgi:hypothetical protein